MSTGNTVLTALCLCLAVAEAFGNLVTVIASRQIMFFPEVPCALTLIPPLFQRADNDSAAYPQNLFVFGKADWLDPLIRQWPSVTSIYVFTEEDTAKFEDTLLAEMMPSASVVLHATIGEAGYNLPVAKRVRYIFWVSLLSTALADHAVSQLSPPDACFSLYRWMVTARPRGTTHVLSVPMPCEMDSAAPPTKNELLGVWSPGAGWSAPHVPIFPLLCASWRPPPDGEPLLAEMFEFAIRGTPSVDRYKGTESYEVLRLLRDSYGLEFQTTASITTKVMMPYRRAETCHLDVVTFPTNPTAVDAMIHAELSYFLWDNDHMICIVPFGAGKPLPLLYPLTAEYTTEVWAALAAVVLAVVACLYLLRREETVQKLVLQTLSPLLGQPLDDRRPGPQIAVLGGWLLTCVVIIGAYQGQLLGFITVPPQNGEINSWQDWLESDLVLIVNNKLITASSADDFGLYGLTEERIDRTDYMSPTFQVATHRNSSFLVSNFMYEADFGGAAAQFKTHAFVVPVPSTPQSRFVTTKGSPFEVPLRKILGRIHAAGGLGHKREYAKHLPQNTEDRPISLLNVRPIIAAYIVGNIFAMFTFVFEFLPPTLRKFCWPRYGTKTKLKPPRPYLP